MGTVFPRVPKSLQTSSLEAPNEADPLAPRIKRTTPRARVLTRQSLSSGGPARPQKPCEAPPANRRFRSAIVGKEFGTFSCDNLQSPQESPLASGPHPLNCRGLMTAPSGPKTNRAEKEPSKNLLGYPFSWKQKSDFPYLHQFRRLSAQTERPQSCCGWGRTPQNVPSSRKTRIGFSKAICLLVGQGCNKRQTHKARNSHWRNRNPSKNPQGKVKVKRARS